MPPMLARRLIEHLTPRRLREDLLSALDDGFERRARTLGADAARAWYWRQLLSLDWVRLRRECPRDEHLKEAWMHSFWQDARFAFRSFARSPSFAIVVVVTLSLGIGANVALMSVARAVLLKPLPYENEEGVVSIWSQWTGFPKTWVSIPEYRMYRETIRSLDEVGLYFSTSANLEDRDDPERIGLAAVTPNIFDVLGVSPSAGRVFSAEEAKLEVSDVILLSHRIWERRYGGDVSLLGSRVEMDGVPRTVIGVLPERFQLPTDFNAEAPTDVYVPLDVPAGFESLPRLGGSHSYYAVGRLANGASVEEARAEFLAANERDTADGIYTPDWRFRTLVIPVSEDVVGDVRPALLVLLGAVGFVLLIACTNVASVVLSRSHERSREVALRSSLGASFGRVFRQLITESVLLAGMGGLTGLVLAYWAIDGLVGLEPGSIPRLTEARVDGGVLLFALGATLATALLFGVMPAIATARSSLRSAVGDPVRAVGSGVFGQRLRGALVALQMALAVVLVAGAGLMIRTFATLVRVDPGFRTENVLTFRLSAPMGSYPDSPSILSLFERVREGLRALPGVEEVGAVRVLPLATSIGDWGTRIEGYEPRPGENPSADWQVASPGYLEAMGIPLIEGRVFTDEDRPDTEPVILVNESMATKYWPGQSAIGKRIMIGGAEDPPWSRIVGVVGNVRHNGITAEIKSKWYRPLSQFHQSSGFTPSAVTFVMRTNGSAELLARSAREVVREVDPKLPVSDVRTLQDVFSRSMGSSRFTMALLVLLSGLALALAVVGVYGVASYLVGQRSREIGLRMALGASPSKMLGLVIRQGLFLAALGTSVGVVAAYSLTQSMDSLLYGVEPRDPITFALVPLVLLAAALAGSVVPAVRASRVDPVRALRAEAL
ncbi:MAG TPA: ABC transporter permease [Vicinamibacteria bacterium]|nr:ABC transporter permease [Vicinamibacteria bacterium]